ncbi:MAG: hypothetical protein ABIV51_10635, partial [Saprospiraceae bacterium]
MSRQLSTYIILSFCALLTAFNAISQSSSWTIKGKITDESGNILYPVSITWGKDQGLINDPNGEFRFEIAQIPASIAFSHLGFQDRELFTDAIPKELFADQVINLLIKLQAKSNQLKTVEIRALKETRLIGSPTLVPLDFCFIDSRIIVLTRNGREYEIHLLDENEKEISKFKLPYPAQSLFTSCLGGIHAVGDTICQELILRAIVLDTVQTYPRERFDKFLLPCLANKDDKFIIQRISNFEKMNGYYLLDSSKHIYEPLHTVIDEIALRDVYTKLNSYIKYFAQNSPEASYISFDGHFADEVGFEQYIIERWEKSGNRDNYFYLIKMASNSTQWQAMSFLRQLLLYPTKPGFIQTTDSIFIFDPIQSQLIPFAWNKQMGEPKSVDIPAGNRLHPMIIV